MIKPLPKNKKGAIGMVFFFIALLGILLLGFFGAMVLSVFDFASDEITPIMEDLGMAGETNISEAAQYGFGTLNTFVQTLPFLLGFGYVLALIFTIVLVYVSGYSPSPAFIGFYFALMILLVFGSIIVSNMYQDIYSGDDEIATRLQEQTLLSYMILHAPTILTFIAIIGGILMFSRIGNGNEGSVNI